MVCLELIQLLENTYLQLRLDEHWTHPDNSGWVELFTLWARSQTFRDVWRNYQDVFAFFVLILVLVFRPSGLMGEKVAERA